MPAGSYILGAPTDDGDPPYPGEDFLVNAPDGVTFPTDLTEATIVISVEPETNLSFEFGGVALSGSGSTTVG